MEERFWSKVDVRGPDECWEWKAGKVKGYGVFWIRAGDPIYAHRMAYQLANGVELTSDVLVRHKCDNPPCCNPRHLLTGTHADNARDREERNRHPHIVAVGSAYGRSNLTEGDVYEIRRLCDARAMSQSEIARRFGISRSAVSDIALRRTWKYLPEPHS